MGFYKHYYREMNGSIDFTQKEEIIYNFDRKESLMGRINRIRDKYSNSVAKIHYEKIRDIIIELNPSIDIIQNSNGLYMCFHNLHNETYCRISEYLDDIAKNI